VYDYFVRSMLALGRLRQFEELEQRFEMGWIRVEIYDIDGGQLLYALEV
jgi:hypothetical protein